MSVTLLTGVGGLAARQDEAVFQAEEERRQFVTPAPGVLAVVVRLFAELASNERLVTSEYGLALGLNRGQRAYIGTRPVRTPPLSSGSAELALVPRRDLEDAVNLMLGRDPEQPRLPQLGWDTLVEVLAREGITVTEEELIGLPFHLEFSPRLQAELAA
jgi:hypothetical protein